MWIGVVEDRWSDQIRVTRIKVATNLRPVERFSIQRISVVLLVHKAAMWRSTPAWAPRSLRYG